MLKAEVRWQGRLCHRAGQPEQKIAVEALLGIKERARAASQYLIQSVVVLDENGEEAWTLSGLARLEFAPRRRHRCTSDMWPYKRVLVPARGRAKRNLPMRARARTALVSVIAACLF